VVQAVQETLLLHQALLILMLHKVITVERGLILLEVLAAAALAVLDRLEVQIRLAAQMVVLVNLHRFQEVQ
jgi:hypothetical protein